MMRFLQKNGRSRARDLLITAITLGAAGMLCMLLRRMD